MTFRDLKASEIEIRVQSAKPNGAILLLYKDARVDMNILDETVGAENWQRMHYECKGNLFCQVGIRCKPAQSETMDYHEWVWKSDCGSESNTEAEKGEASDSFKRACFNWGIGRELYTAPFVWVSSDKCNIKPLNNGKFTCNDKFSVSEITIKDKVITAIKIMNDNTRKVAFTYGLSTSSQPPAQLDKVICPQCGVQVVSKPHAKTGKMCTAQEVLQLCGGVCPDCMKKNNPKT